MYKNEQRNYKHIVNDNKPEFYKGLYIENENKETSQIQTNNISTYSEYTDMINCLKNEKHIIINKTYLNQRKQLIQNIKTFINNYNMSEATYHLAVFLMDKILRNYTLDYQIVLIVCSMLASIII